MNPLFQIHATAKNEIQVSLPVLLLYTKKLVCDLQPGK